jgi:hypothetical protein
VPLIVDGNALAVSSYPKFRKGRAVGTAHYCRGELDFEGAFDGGGMVSFSAIPI